MYCLSSRAALGLRSLPSFQGSKVSFSWKSLRSSPWIKFILAGGVATVGVITFAGPVLASELILHPAHLPWYHKGVIATYDHASVRRGYQVYKEVCAACHSLKYLTFRQLVDHVLTEEEAKADAAENMIIDGPDDKGKMFERRGRLTDLLPLPYPNDEAARAANNGASPPDLTFVVKAREGKEDYIFHLLTGYCDAPPGRVVEEPQYYNPYFPGGAISMARSLYDELIEYKDGTPATTSQMAKDVVSFLTWSSDRTHDQRKRVLIKAIFLLALGSIVAAVYKRKIWSNLKSRKLIYKNRPIPKDV